MLRCFPIPMQRCTVDYEVLVHWLSDLLRERGDSIYRSKAILKRERRDRRLCRAGRSSGALLLPTLPSPARCSLSLSLSLSPLSRFPPQPESHLRVLHQSLRALPSPPALAPSADPRPSFQVWNMHGADAWKEGATKMNKICCGAPKVGLEFITWPKMFGTSC